MIPNQLPETESVLRARLLINDLLRLGILGEVQAVDQGKTQTVGDAIIDVCINNAMF